MPILGNDKVVVTMSFIDALYNITLGVLMIAGLVSVVYTIPKVQKWWRPVYWCAIPLAALPIVMVVIVTVEQFTNIDLLPGSTLLSMLKLILFVLALQLIAVPFVHRLEAKYLAASSVTPPEAIVNDGD